MKKLCTLLMVAAGATAAAQTQQLYFEDFINPFQADVVLNSTSVNSVNSGNNIWTINNNYAGGNLSIFCFSTFNVPIPATPAQPNGITNPNGNYMHLTSLDGLNQGVANAHYRGTDSLCTFTERYFAHMSQDVNTTGMSNVTLKFWWACDGAPNVAFGELYYSTNAGGTWIRYQNFSMVNQSTWTQANITDPLFSNRAQLRFGWRFVNFYDGQAQGSDPSISIDDIEITAPIIVPTIATSNPSSSTLCSGQSITVPFTLTNGPMSAGNSFTLEMSDASGNFTGNVIGTLNATTGSSITGTLPTLSPGTSGYLFRVNASNPQTTGTANGTPSSTPVALSLNFNYQQNGLDVQVTNTSSSSPNAQWLFCPGTYVPTGGQPYTHTFPGSGSYCVCIKADNGCLVDSVCQTVNLCADVDAGVNLTVDGPLVTIPDSISGADSIFVDFGMGATVTNPSLPYVHTYTSLGPKTICIYAYNECGNADTNCVTVTISSLQGIEDASELFRIFPNPSSDVIQINGLPILGWNLYSLTGQLLKEESYGLPQTQHQLSVQDLAAGTYLLILQGTNQTWHSRISVVH